MKVALSVVGALFVTMALGVVWLMLPDGPSSSPAAKVRKAVAPPAVNKELLAWNKTKTLEKTYDKRLNDVLRAVKKEFLRKGRTTQLSSWQALSGTRKKDLGALESLLEVSKGCAPASRFSYAKKKSNFDSSHFVRGRQLLLLELLTSLQTQKEGSEIQKTVARFLRLQEALLLYSQRCQVTVVELMVQRVLVLPLVLLFQKVLAHPQVSSQNKKKAAAALKKWATRSSRMVSALVLESEDMKRALKNLIKLRKEKVTSLLERIKYNKPFLDLEEMIVFDEMLWQCRIQRYSVPFFKHSTDPACPIEIYLKKWARRSLLRKMLSYNAAGKVLLTVANLHSSSSRFRNYAYREAQSICYTGAAFAQWARSLSIAERGQYPKALLEEAKNPLTGKPFGKLGETVCAQKLTKRWKTAPMRLLPLPAPAKPAPSPAPAKAP